MISGFYRGVNEIRVFSFFFFGILRSVERIFLTDVSGRSVGPIFKGHAVQEELTF